MNTDQMVQCLLALAKRYPFPSANENKLLKLAALKMSELQALLDAQREQIYRLTERIGIMADGNPAFSETNEALDAVAPGEAAEDFWDDDWPMGD